MVTIVAIFLFLSIFFMISGESKLTENINDTVEKVEDLIDVDGLASPPSCEDSDGGKNYFVAGSATTSSETFDDSCDSGTLTEWWCNGDDAETVTYICPKGCTGNACTGGSVIVDECRDDDGGLNYFTYGVVTMGEEAYTDKCIILQGMSVLVREYICDKTDDNPVKVAENVYQCPEGCENSACMYGG